MIRSLALAVVVTSACQSLPAGKGGGEADTLAHGIEKFVDKDAWDQKTGAVSWTFRDKRSWTWDKQRGFVVMKSGDLDVALDLWDHGGFAHKAGVELAGPEKDKALADAWQGFCNDMFWLNPLVKLFDAGTTRELVDVDGKKGLKVSYASGGVTPGDTYVWIVDGDKPVAVRMWVSVLPIKGLEFTWDHWVTLPSGAKLATEHKSAGMDHAVFVADVKAGASASDLGVDALFAPLVKRRAG